ncbi:hypothetical protein HDV01_005204 [Terramyces sp. JEL0728]|nr:hypothetical protein HDV01_005204 [Terramyces sp. JEL0728]
MRPRIIKKLSTAAFDPSVVKSVDITFKDGAKSILYNRINCSHGVWLRDHCRCNECFHPVTKQRLVNTSDIPLNASPVKIDVTDAEVHIEWEDKHKTTFDSKWLRENSYAPKYNAPKELKRIYWGKNITYFGANLSDGLPVTAYKDIMHSEEGLKEWLLNVETYGIGFVDGVPISSQETNALANRISFIRKTHYGEFWDFTSNLAHGDTAYTSIALPAHTDTTYFSEPVGLQFFHLIEHRGEGGESLYVDGFNVARQLKERHPWAYDALSKLQISAHRHLYQIRYNDNDRSTLNLSPENTVLFYAALREWQRLVTLKENEFWIKLKGGRAVVMDNWRVLHGRASFNGYRRMLGSYHGYDDFQSKLKALKNMPFN